MISAREAVTKIRLSSLEETEVQRLGAEVVAAVRAPDGWDGTPICIKVLEGKTEGEKKSAWRIVCAVKRRFEGEGWEIAYDVEHDEFGERERHVLWFAVNAVSARLLAGAAPPPATSLRSLVEEAAVALGGAGVEDVPAAPPDPDISVLLGTHNRFAMLRRAVASIRRSVGALTYEIVVADGGSADGSRQWLAAQPDVVLVGERRLDGAVRAFNQAFALARGKFIANLNDDCVVRGSALADAVAHLAAHSGCGQVAIPFRGGRQSRVQTNDVYPRESNPGVSWGTRYANFGVARRGAADAVARIQGGFWNPTYRTYSGDAEFSAWVWRLGHTVDELATGATVEDAWAEDDLREKNAAGAAAEAKRFYARWPAEALKPDGPPPRVSAEEIERYASLCGSATRLPGVELKQAAPPDVVETMAELCGLPQPGEERRLRRQAQLVRALDPAPGQFPQCADRLPAERVLHVSLCTDADPQAGLVRALRALGSGGYEEVRWLADYPEHPETRQQAIVNAARRLRPTFVFMQLQAPDAVAVETVKYLREFGDPSCVIAMWSGDVAGENSPWQVDWQVPLGRVVDLVLHSSMTHVWALRAAGLHNAGYLQIGYDEEQYRSRYLRTKFWDGSGRFVGSDPESDEIVPHDDDECDYDVAFLGSRYGAGDRFAESYRWRSGVPAHDAELRDEVVAKMREAFGDRFGLFGRGWGPVGGIDQVVPLGDAHDVYQRSKIGLSISFDNSLECYTSDRLFRILGSGALLLVKRFPRMDVLGLAHGENCLAWGTTDDAVFHARHVVAQPKYTGPDYASMAVNGAALARARHTWLARMREIAPYVGAVREARR